MLGRQTRRIEYIDVFRAFGIILMVMGHIGFGNKFDHFIHAFHMPMFFFVSGFLYKKREISLLSYLKKKAMSLMIPYFVFGLFHYLFFSVQNGFQLEPIKAWLLFPAYEGIPIAEALWFLPALFFADIIYYWLIKMIKNSSILWVIVIMISLIGQVLPAKLGIRVPFAIAPAMVGVGLMHLGRSLRPYEQCVVNLKVYLVLLFGALTALSLFQSGYVNMRTDTYPSEFILFWVNAVAASIIGLNIANILKRWFKNSIPIYYLQSVGRNAIVYVCLNQIVILLCGKMIRKGFRLLFVSFKNVFWLNAIELVTSLAVLFLLAFLFEKTIFRVFVGKYNTKTIN